MDLFKKLFAGVTIVAMAMITVAPAGFAHAASLSDGDLVKKASSSAVYYYTNGKRYVFPTESTYKTWYSDFSKVKTIESAELSAIPLGGNVTFRPGTNLVKITTDPKVYAVSPNGNLHWVKSEAAAKTLFGNDWSKMVKDVPDGFFTNYKVSSVDLDGTKHVPGQVIKYNGSDKMYYITSDWKKREFTGNSFAMNGFNSMYVVTSPDSITYPNGSDITGAETMLWDAAQMGGGSTVPPTTGNGSLSVALASDTPAASDIPAGSTAASNVIFTKLNFTAGGDDVKVSKVRVKREGLSADTDLSNVKLFDMDNKQLGTSQSFDANHVATFLVDWTVKAGTTKSLYVKGDSAASKTGRIKLGLADANALDTNAKSVSGSFPMFGNTMTQVDVSVGQLTISRGPSDPTGTTTVDIDDKKFRFAQVRLQAGSVEAAKVKSITWREGDNSTVGDGDVTNVYLKDDTNNKTYQPVKDGDNYIFNFSPAVSIAKGDTADFSLFGDVVDGSGKVVTFALIEDSDWLIQADGAQYGYGMSLSPSASTTGVNFGSGTATDAETESFSINQGTLTVSKSAKTPATGEISLGGKDVKIAAWDFEVRGEDVRVGTTKVSLTETAGFDADVDADLYKLVDADGKVWAGPYDASGTVITFSTQMIFPVGTTTLFLTANIASTGLTAGTDKIAAFLDMDETSVVPLATVKGMTSNKTVTPGPSASDISGNTMTVDAADLRLTMGATPIASTYVLGVKNFHFATGRLDATNGSEDVNVTSMTLGAGSFSGTIDISTDLTNFKAMHKGKQIGETEQPTSSDTIVFNIDEEFIVPKNEILEVEFYMDVPSDAGFDTDTTNFEFEAGAGVGTDSGSSVTAANGSGTALSSTNGNESATLTWSTAGLLKVTLDGNNPTGQVVASSTTDLEVARYKFKAEYEDIDVTTLNLYAGKDDSATSSVGNTEDPAAAADNISRNVTKVKVYEGTTLLGSTIFNSSGLATLQLDAGDLRIKKDNDHIIKIVVDLAHKSVLDSGENVFFGFQDGDGDGSDWGDSTTEFTMTANGVASGSNIATINSTGASGGIAAGGNMFIPYDGILTVSLNPNSPSGNFSAGVGTEVLRLDLSATGDEIGIEEMEIDKAGSCTVTGTGGGAIESIDGATDYWTLVTTAFGNIDFETDDTNVSNTGLTALKVGAGETKTIKYTIDTTNSCSDGETLQYILRVDPSAADEVLNGVEWYDQELGSGAPVSGTNVVIKNLPVYGNVLEI